MKKFDVIRTYIVSDTIIADSAEEAEEISDNKDYTGKFQLDIYGIQITELEDENE